MESTIGRKPYERPEAGEMPLEAARFLCVSTGTAPYDDLGEYNWES